MGESRRPFCGTGDESYKSSRRVWDGSRAHRSDNGRVVTLEYEVHGKILATDTPYDNRFVSIATIENRKIVRWRDYMDLLAAWRASNRAT
jgi:uncharacterized protein